MHYESNIEKKKKNIEINFIIILIYCLHTGYGYELIVQYDKYLLRDGEVYKIAGPTVKQFQNITGFYK